MELEETKKVLLIIQDKIEYELQFIYEKNKRTELNEYVQAIDTVIHELVALQNLLDEKNEEIEHLQKENEDKKTYEFGLIVGTKRERDWWENKIKEKLEYLKLNCGNSFVIDALEDLLKEERVYE